MSTITGDPRRHQNCGNVTIALAVIAVILVVVWLIAEAEERGRREQLAFCRERPAWCQDEE